MTYAYPEELVHGEVIYYYLLNYSGDFAHGPFTIKISDGIIYLVNEGNVEVPLERLLTAIQLLRPNWPKKDEVDNSDNFSGWFFRS